MIIVRGHGVVAALAGLALAAVAGVALGLVWLAMPETRPQITDSRSGQIARQPP